MANARNNQAKTPAQMAHELIHELIALTPQQIAKMVAKRRDCEFMDEECPDDICSRYVEFLRASGCLHAHTENCQDYWRTIEELMAVIRTQAVTQDLVVENGDKLETNISTLVAAFDDPDSPDCRKYVNGFGILRDAVNEVKLNPHYRPPNQVPAPPRKPNKPKPTRTGWSFGYGMLAGAAVGTIVAVGLIVAGVLTFGTVPAIVAAIGVGVAVGAACGVIGVGAVTAKIDEVRDKAYQAQHDAYVTPQRNDQHTYRVAYQQMRQGSSSARRPHPHTAQPDDRTYTITKINRTYKVVSTAPIPSENASSSDSTDSTAPSNSFLR